MQLPREPWVRFATYVRGPLSLCLSLLHMCMVCEAFDPLCCIFAWLAKPREADPRGEEEEEEEDEDATRGRRVEGKRSHGAPELNQIYTCVA